MKKILKKQFFNLIEVTMAIAVVGIGIAGVMAMLPPAIEANKSADYNNYTGDVVSTLASYMETELRRNWSTALSSIPSSKPSTTALQFTPADDDSSKEETDRRWKTITGLNGIYRIHATAAGSHTPGVFGVKSMDESVRANILVWRDGTGPVLEYHGSSGQTVTPTGARVVFELSYPAGLPYAQRTIKQFVYEFYQQ